MPSLVPRSTLDQSLREMVKTKERLRLGVSNAQDYADAAGYTADAQQELEEAIADGVRRGKEIDRLRAHMRDWMKMRDGLDYIYSGERVGPGELTTRLEAIQVNVMQAQQREKALEGELVAARLEIS